MFRREQNLFLGFLRFLGCGRFGRSGGSGGHVVQIMGYVVTFLAAGELGHHPGGVRCAMTILAFGHHFVLGNVAGCAGELAVFRFAGNQHVKSFLVTCSALLRRGFRGVGNCFRHVCLVAFLAVRWDDIGGVSFMARCAERFLAVGIVAECTGKGGVLALVFLELDDLRFVAGEAGVGLGFGERDKFGYMGVLVATETIIQLVMFFVGMALVTGGNNFFHCRRMVGGVAVLATDLGLVFPTLGIDVSDRLCVAFDAIGI